MYTSVATIYNETYVCNTIVTYQYTNKIQSYTHTLIHIARVTILTPPPHLKGHNSDLYLFVCVLLGKCPSKLY